MNPLGFLIVALGLALVIVGVTGSQHKVVAALTNKPANQSGGSANTAGLVTA